MLVLWVKVNSPAAKVRQTANNQLHSNVAPYVTIETVDPVTTLVSTKTAQTIAKSTAIQLDRMLDKETYFLSFKISMNNNPGITPNNQDVPIAIP